MDGIEPPTTPLRTRPVRPTELHFHGRTFFKEKVRETLIAVFGRLIRDLAIGHSLQPIQNNLQLRPVKSTFNTSSATPC